MKRLLWDRVVAGVKRTGHEIDADRLCKLCDLSVKSAQWGSGLFDRLSLATAVLRFGDVVSSSDQRVESKRKEGRESDEKPFWTLWKSRSCSVSVAKCCPQ